MTGVVEIQLGIDVNRTRQCFREHFRILYDASTSLTRILVCCVVCIKLYYVSYSPIYWSIH